MTQPVLLLLATPVVFAIFAWLSGGRAPQILALLGTATTLVMAVALMSAPEGWDGSRPLLHVDGRAAFHAALASLIGLAASAVALGRPRGERDHAAPILLTVLGAALATLCARELGARLAALELLAVLSALLVGSDRGEGAMRAAWRHLAAATAGIALLAVGCTIAGVTTRTDVFALAPSDIAVAANGPRHIASMLVVIGLGALLGAAPVGVGVASLMRGVDGVRAAPVVALTSIAAIDLLTRFTLLTTPTPLLALGITSLALGALGSLRGDVGASSYATYAGLVLAGLGLGSPIADEAIVVALLANAAHVIARSLRLLAEETPLGGAFHFFARSLGFGGMPPTASFLATLMVLRIALAAGRPWLAAAIATAVAATGVALVRDARESEVATAHDANPYAFVALGVLALVLLGGGLVVAVPAGLAALVAAERTP